MKPSENDAPKVPEKHFRSPNLAEGEYVETGDEEEIA